MMKNFKSLILFLIFLIFSSCDQEDELPDNSICATILCVPAVSFFKLKFVDKNTDANLLFNDTNNGMKYNLSDVKIYSTRFRKNLDFRVDSANKSDRFLIFSTAVTDEFIISLANQPTDKLSVETQFIDQPCCDELRLTKLTLNASAIPFTQFTPTTIILKK